MTVSEITKEVGKFKEQGYKVVPKQWGWEVWLVNNKKYCGKYLYYLTGHQSSLHYHKYKDETFVVLDGKVDISINGEVYDKNVLRIYPEMKHQVIPVNNAKILEVSTHHDDNDTFRLTESA